ncbi:MAG: ParB/RepB/Spo0J family partition protein [Oscillospiraceae bacterium]|nr:ParB/RepB/Spo0J family partition protein [Oscillospiraceae bacterium]
MAPKKSGLGKGYNAIFVDNSVDEISGNNGPEKVKLIDIEPNREQPRKVFDEEALNELANSISQHGVLQPLLVRPMPSGVYQLVAGERRWRASRLAGLTEVPVIIRDLTDSEVAEIALVENLQRENLNPLEEANGYKELQEKFRYTQEKIAEIVGKSRSSVANSLRLLSLPGKIQKMVSDGVLTTGHAKAILSVEDDKLKSKLAKIIAEKELSVREAEKLARSIAKESSGKPKIKKRNPYYDEAELALSEVLGRKVSITKSSKKGSLEIEFFDDDDLKKLLKIFDNE